MREMTLYGVSFEPIGKQPIVLLKTVDEDRFLPIWIGHAEAAAILMKLQGATPPRPMTHDLLTNVVSELQGEVVKRHRHGAPREHVLRADHDRPGRPRGRDRLAPVRRDRARRPLRGADLRGRRGGRGVRHRVPGRRRGAGGPRHGVEPRRPRSRGVPAFIETVTPEEFASSLEDARARGADEDDEDEDDEDSSAYARLATRRSPTTSRAIAVERGVEQHRRVDAVRFATRSQPTTIPKKARTGSRRAARARAPKSTPVARIASNDAPGREQRDAETRGRSAPRRRARRRSRRGRTRRRRRRGSSPTRRGRALAPRSGSKSPNSERTCS